MNTATSNLENDHLHILRLTDVMEKMVLTEAINIPHLETIVELIKKFADGLHHTKEESLLFPKMVEKGFSFQQGPIAVMMNDHEEGRNFVKGISENISLYKSGNKSVKEDIFQNMHGYIELLRNHIEKENNILFRMADKVLNAEEQKLLSDEFQKLEVYPVTGEIALDYIKRIEKLAGEYI